MRTDETTCRQCGTPRPWLSWHGWAQPLPAASGAAQAAAGPRRRLAGQRQHRLIGATRTRQQKGTRRQAARRAQRSTPQLAATGSRPPESAACEHRFCLQTASAEVPALAEVKTDCAAAGQTKPGRSGGENAAMAFSSSSSTRASARGAER